MHEPPQLAVMVRFERETLHQRTYRAGISSFGWFNFYVEFISTLADIWTMQIAAITLAFLVLNALLWYSRPNGSLWLLGSIVLGVIWGAVFLRLITKEPGSQAK